MEADDDDTTIKLQAGTPSAVVFPAQLFTWLLPLNPLYSGLQQLNFVKKLRRVNYPQSLIKGKANCFN
ncbi:MAG: hypothetical protein IPH34_04260 [Chitinophagaceae bacterium]|nr:hypothetical protein [Chitinophagaceae bacterium]